MTKKSLKASSRSNHSRKSNKKNRTNDKHKKSRPELKQSENYQKRAEKRLQTHTDNAASGGVKIQIESTTPTTDTKSLIDQELSNVKNVEQVKMAFNNQVMIRGLIQAKDIKSQFDDFEGFSYKITHNSKSNLNLAASSASSLASLASSSTSLSSLSSKCDEEENETSSIGSGSGSGVVVGGGGGSDETSAVETVPSNLGSALKTKLFKQFWNFGFDRNDIMVVLDKFVTEQHERDYDDEEDDNGDDSLIQNVSPLMIDCLDYMWKHMKLPDQSSNDIIDEQLQQNDHSLSRNEVLEEEIGVMRMMFGHEGESDDVQGQGLLSNASKTVISIQVQCDELHGLECLSNARNENEEELSQTYLHIFIPETCAYPRQSAIFVIGNDRLPVGAKNYLLKQMKMESATMVGQQMIYPMYLWVQSSIVEKVEEWQREQKRAKMESLRSSEGQLVSNTAKQQTSTETVTPSTALAKEAPQIKDEKSNTRASKGKQKRTLVRSKNIRPSTSTNSLVTQEKLSEQDLARISDQLLSSFLEKQKSPKYIQMQNVRNHLPVSEYREDILEAIDENQVVLITAETGCGKTTQIPQFILDHMLLNGSGATCNIICTQPRRISAIGVAERVAAERDESIGGMIGYSIQLESKRSNATKLLFCTTGVLLRMIENDPAVSNITHIIVDEVHERSLDSDFLLIVLKRLMKQRRDLKIILMSATMNAELFSDYFNDCETLYIPGRTFPIESFYLEDVIEATGYVCTESNAPKQSSNKKQQGNQKSQPQMEDKSEKVFDAKKYSERTLKALSNMDEKAINYELIVKLMQHIVKKNKEDTGSILIFLPGIAEITQLYNMLTSDDTFKDGNKFSLLPLHSSLSTQSQQRVFEVPKPGCRKIIISTNIAETSITIDDCTVVIDTGKMKQTQYSAQSRMSSLVECWVSRANALQRRGRAGRVRPGKAYNLYTKFRFETRFKEQQLPEIFRVSLESLCLRIKSLKMDGSIEQVLSQALEPPSSSAIKSSVSSLVMLRALNSEEELTPLGAHLAKIPIDVQLAKMILYAAMLRCLDPVLTIAASMGNQSPFLSPINQREEARRAHQKLCVEKSDHLSLLKAYHKWTQAVSDKKERVFCNVNYLSNTAFQQIILRKKQFVELLAEIGFISIVKWHKNPYREHELDAQCNQNSHNLAMVKACLVAGLYPNVALVTEKDNEARVFTPSNGQVSLHPSSFLFQDTLFENRYLVYLEKVKTSKLFIRDATMVTPYSLMLFGGQLTYDKDVRQLTVDKWIKFRVDKDIAVLMDQLRIKVNMYLERLIERQHKPESEITAEELEEENSLVLAISELLGTEHSIHAFENWWADDESTTSVRLKK